MAGSARRNVLSLGSRYALLPLALPIANAAHAGDPPYLVETALAAGTQQIERATHIDVGLFAGDARTDLLVIAADASGRRVAQVWEQTAPGANGAFVLRQVLTMPGSVVDVVPTDLDRDGGEDIVVLTDDAEDSLGVFVQQPASPTAAPYQRNAQRFALPSKTTLGRVPAGSGPTFEYRIVVAGDGASPALMFRPDGAQGLVAMAQSFPRPGATHAVSVLDADGDNALDFILFGTHPQRLWLSRPGGYVEQVLSVGIGTVAKAVSSSGDRTGDGRVDPLIVDDMGRVITLVAQPPATPGSGHDFVVTSIHEADPSPAVDAMLFDVTGAGDPALLIARAGTADTPGSLDVHRAFPGGGYTFLPFVYQRFTGSYAALQFGSAKLSDGYVTAFAGTLANGLRTYRVGTAGGVSTITATLERTINPRVVELTAATMYVEMTLRADPPVSRRVEIPIVDTIAFDGPPRNSVAVFEPGASTAVWQSNVEARWRTDPTWQIGAVSDPDVAIGTTAPLTLILPPSLYAGFGGNIRACTSCAVAEFGDPACPLQPQG